MALAPAFNIRAPPVQAHDPRRAFESAEHDHDASVLGAGGQPFPPRCRSIDHVIVFEYSQRTEMSSPSGH
jgi:hypothetical protein